MSELFDHRQVRRAFSRAAHHYDDAAGLQREVGARLLESLDYFDERAQRETPGGKARTPQVVLDVGCGPGHATAQMQQRWPKAQVLALDLALPMLRETQHNAGGWRPFKQRPQALCADARALPLADGCVDVLFSNLCLQWVEDLPAVFAGFRRVLKPDGLMVLSTFGPDTLWELREAFGHADSAPHVSPFASIAQFGDALIAAGFKDPVLDRDEFHLQHSTLGDLMRELRTLGATNALSTRRRSLTGRERFARAAQGYEPLRRDGKLPATWEVITAHAWGPQPGTPIRLGGIDEVAVPVAKIPIRRRG
ncbi:malonyl-CoA O-methyltransferase [Lysobacter niabensis]|uniref:Malonyl-[acyl-carrier protein] O-methyltransferase n=1 Tax=Agrilutibacter niabensis TaxID=380628 RepID=A0ABU1VRZ9_9GAMM|nr:malonyl-ACP O-methyltransferase BioC [Lysobacter niabensis]MDR7100130.1 malonyl-CoA O-methyltransferase [Lysobacter niabensis]